jgi:hypothetical protein
MIRSGFEVSEAASNCGSFKKRNRVPRGVGLCTRATPRALRVGLVEFIGGQDATTGLVDEALARRARGSQGPVDLGENLVGLRVWPGAPSL